MKTNEEKLIESLTETNEAYKTCIIILNKRLGIVEAEYNNLEYSNEALRKENNDLYKENKTLKEKLKEE